MHWYFCFVLLFLTITTGWGLNCTPIPSNSMFDGNTVHLPGPSDELQIIPPNFNCLYKITVPFNSTNGLWAFVKVRNGLRGVNDYVRVVDILGNRDIIKYGNGGFDPYYVVPGTEMTIQVVTKSVDMQSKLDIIVQYHNAQIGPTYPMKTGAEMNYVDVTSLRDGKSKFNSVTFVGTEPIYMTDDIFESSIFDFLNCFVVDGTTDNITSIYPITDIYLRPFTTRSNAITIWSSSDAFLGLVFNPKSEADKYPYLDSLTLTTGSNENSGLSNFDAGVPAAKQVVNFRGAGIVMDSLSIHNRTYWDTTSARFDTEATNCTAYVLSGPPNNSSKVLLDLTTSPAMPHLFDVNDFSVVSMDCEIQFNVKSYNN